MSAETQDRKSQCSGGQDDEQGGSSVGEDRMSRADESESVHATKQFQAH